jgi:hypothetical protein
MASHESFGHVQHKLWSKEGPGVKLAIWLATTKSQDRPNPGVCKWNATHRWKALEESYKFASDLISIGGLSWELWAPKVLRVQTGTKSHSDVGAMVKRREYYMGEGGGFPWVRAVVSQVSPYCPWLVPTSKVFPNMN